MSNHCLVCGNQNTGKKHLINKLITNVQFNRINTNHHECIWQIMNKYYESDVTLTIINSLDLITPNQTDDDDAIQTNPALDLSQFSAIILVLNLNQAHSLIEKDMKSWIHVLSPYLASSECSLLIGNYIDSYSSNPTNQTKQKEYHQFLHNFCVDNYFEFVPSPNDNDNAFYGYNSSLFSTYDAMELSHNRINSALQCVMWPNMDRNTGKKASNSHKMNKIQPLLSTTNTQEKHGKYVMENEQKVNEKKDDFTEKNKFKKGDKVVLFDLKSKQNWNGKVAEIVGPFSKSKKRWPIQLELIENENVCVKKALIKSINLVIYKEKVVANSNAMVEMDEEKVNENKEIENKEFVQNMLWNAGNELNINENENENESNESLEGKMSSFQSLINEMHQVRSAAKSGKLSDDERRQRAADTAMKLMSYMGLEKQDNEAGVNEEND